MYLGGGGISPLSVGDGGSESTVVYPFPQHEPSNGDRSLALKNIHKSSCLTKLSQLTNYIIR